MKKLLSLFILSLAFIACDTDETPVQSSLDQAKMSIVSASPWVTTAVYREVNGEIDRSVNFIDTPLASGTISSAQYSNSSFVFVPVNHITGEFDLSNEGILNNHGLYEIAEEGDNLVRNITCTFFGYSNSRVITEINDNMFTYKFIPSAENGNIDNSYYYVEHEPYSTIFPEKTYPSALQSQVDELFSTMDLDCS